jgi:thiol-disulfide isomerase/thioredoxin
MKNIFSIFFILSFVLNNTAFSQTNSQTIVEENEQTNIIKEDIYFDYMSDSEIVDYVINASIDRDSSKVGLSISDFFAENIDGSIFSSSENKRIVLYNCWLSTCAPCIAEIPMLNKLYEKYKDKIDFVSVTFMDINEIKKFLNEYPFAFKHIRMNRNKLESLEINKKSGYPTITIAIDEKIIYFKSGGSTPSFKYFDIVMEGLYHKLDSILQEALQIINEN